MKIYFEDPEYDGQFLRTVAYGPLGAQIGEAWAIASQINAGDPASWYNEWSSYADRLYDLAIKSQATGHRVSARNAFLRASNYYRSAYIFMFALPVDPRVITAYQKHLANITAIRLLSAVIWRGFETRLNPAAPLPGIPTE